jgi:hydrogenase maturation protease
MTARTLVLGLGNVLLRDEGLGVWVAESLGRRFELPASVTILEGGTLGLDLLPRLDGVERLLLVDAVKLGRMPGAMVRLAGEEVPAALHVKFSPHQVGIQDLLAAARLMEREPQVVVLWGMEPERLDPGTGFSPAVKAALPRLRAAVLEELHRWGVAARPRSRVAPPPVWWGEPARGIDGPERPWPALFTSTHFASWTSPHPAVSPAGGEGTETAPSPSGGRGAR